MLKYWQTNSKPRAERIEISCIESEKKLRMKRSFTLEYRQDDGWFVGKLKEIPGVFSQGKTIEELKENIVDAYRMMRQDPRHPEIKDSLVRLIKKQLVI